jgi:phytoene dehydrogenase-like protein
LTSKKHGIIIGGGHNGLVAACYLAKAGHKITVLEARDVVGGAAVTEEFHPGFRNSTASYTVSLLHPTVMSDLNLAGHGLDIIERPVSNFLPLPDGNFLALYPDLARTQKEFAKFSAHDSAALPRYYDDLEAIVPLVRWAMLQTPPNTINGGILDLFKVFQLSRQFAALTAADKRRLLKLFTISADEYLSEYFESEPIKAVFGFDAVVGHFDSPFAPGSAYVLLHHVVGGVNGKSGTWGHARGGMGAITQAMATEAEHLGVSIRTGTPVERVMVTNGQANGIMTSDGTHMAADFVVANVNPRLLHEKLLADEHIAPETKQHFKHYKSQSGTFRLNVALSQLPTFTAQPDSEVLKGGIIMAPSLKYMERAYQDARQSDFSINPIVEMLIPSLVDDSLAPPKQHVASLFCQHFDPSLGAGWVERKAAAIEAIFNVVEASAPGFKDLILAVQSHSPWDLEQKFGLTGGDIFHGRLSLDQLFSARPMLGMAQYQSQISHLFLCGAGTHPGGGVSGIPGMNAAREIIRRL